MQITEKMIRAGIASLQGFSSQRELVVAVYEAMRAAAPRRKPKAGLAQ